MKNLLFFLLLFPLVSIAQLADEVKVKQKSTHELAINVTFFIKQFVSFSDNSIISVPYVLSYKLIKPSKKTLRVGLGGDFRTENMPDQGFGSVLSIYNVDARIGYEKQYDIGKKMLVFAGIDAVNSISGTHSKTTSNFGSAKFSTISHSYGAGPVLGFQFNFTDRIGLFTETSALLNTTFNKSKSRFSDDPSLDSENKSTSSGFNFIIPTSIFFAVRF